MIHADEAAYQLVRAIGLGAAIALGLALEHWRPHSALRPAWATNVGLWSIGTVLTTVVCGACGWTVAGWAGAHGFGLFAWLGVGGWAAVALGVVGLDGVSYGWHWANHRVPLLWRFHRVHHSDASFHVTTAVRFHPGELLLALPLRLAAVVALGVSPTGVLVFEVVFGVANLLEHGNFDLPRRYEPLVQRILITPALHRAHHVCDWAELDSNFGTVFSTWDRLIGTLRPSDGDRRVVTGLPDWTVSRAPSLYESLLLPLEGRRRPTR